MHKYRHDNDDLDASRNCRMSEPAELCAQISMMRMIIVMPLLAFFGSVRPSSLALSLWTSSMAVAWSPMMSPMICAAVACTTVDGSVSFRSSLWKDEDFEDCVAAEPRARDSGAADSLLGIVWRPSPSTPDCAQLAHNPERIRGSGGPPRGGAPQ